MLCGNSIRPVLKLLSGPLKAMIGVAELASGQCLPHHVVFRVGSGQHDGPWLSEFKQDSFQGGKPRGIEVFDDFNDRRRIKAFQPLVSIDQRSVDQFQTLRLPCGEAVELQSFLGHLQRVDRNVHADDFVKLPILQQFTQQLAFAATKVENPAGTTGSESSHDHTVTLIVQAQRFFQ